MIVFPRPDGREPDQLRPIKFELNIAPHAHGSVLSCMGNTRVICAASLERKVPKWMSQQNVEGGWVTAEYSLLPYSTGEGRKPRELSKGKPEGRTVEIQRLIGRALRSVVDLKRLSGYTLWVDCDVLQADGGTRVAAINGAYLALEMAFRKALSEGILKHNPMLDCVSAVSVGLYNSEAILDLNYLEDKDAQVDFNLVMTGSGQFIEVQGGAEASTFSEDQFQSLIALGKKGISEITAKQKAAL